eukprot:CAMPEP_0175959792 /NCGR_PEP_ID=MMETSP0108-20121206/34998_1 /TAXON_ID=195067 ORGANISM="Goniomonas pacifica, Strain CCMP1869" /NCGR_SAMPLE_ID=MMETSP0108 /ASSEMBLY_ACC=CAM_ASM_000204 /LENGTH=55 /DNA_ID=CAMNT_0017287293 /DNA_START=40 /DNA_END=207 /DNA_ORIENTATION=+
MVASYVMARVLVACVRDVRWGGKLSRHVSPSGRVAPYSSLDRVRFSLKVAAYEFL